MTPEGTNGEGEVVNGTFEQLIGNPAIAFIIKVVFAIVFVLFLVFVSKIIAAMVRRRVVFYAKGREEHQVEQVARLIHDMVFYSLVVFAFFIGFEILGFDVALILGGISLGLGLAFKEFLGNMIAGIMLLTNKEIKLGDIVQMDIDPTTSYFGRIEEINLRYTLLRTFDLRQIVLPNMVLISSAIQTFSAEELVRLETIIQVHYETDLDFATRVFTEAINSCSCVLTPERTTVLTNNLGESGIDMKCLFFINPNAGLLIDQAIAIVNERITNYARANGVKIPYPHTTLSLDSEDPQLMQGINEMIMKQSMPKQKKEEKAAPKPKSAPQQSQKTQ